MPNEPQRAKPKTGWQRAKEKQPIRAALSPAAKARRREWLLDTAERLHRLELSEHEAREGDDKRLQGRINRPGRNEGDLFLMIDQPLMMLTHEILRTALIGTAIGLALYAPYVLIRLLVRRFDSNRMQHE